LSISKANRAGVVTRDVASAGADHALDPTITPETAASSASAAE
jgi:hypothetical protein